MKKKLLIFHPALAPYRVDQFNSLNLLFDLHIVFIFDNVWNHPFDQKKLSSQLNCSYSFLLNGIRYKGRVFRFGMLKVIREINPDVIVGYEYSFTTQYLVLLKRLKLIQKPIASTIDDSIDMCNHVQSKVRYKARNFTLDYLDFIIVLSTEVSDYYKQTFLISSSKIVVSPILQDELRLKKKPEQLELIARKYQDKYHLKGKKVLLFVGRLIKEKGLPNFIDCVNNVFKENENLIFIIVGDGAENSAIKQMIEDHGLLNQVILPGRFEAEELYSWYLTASAFVLPSTYEPFGAVVNEALLFGLPVFCSKYAGASNLVKSGNGLLYDPLNKFESNLQFKTFLSKINDTKDVSVDYHKTLMNSYKENFNKEWLKFFN